MENNITKKGAGKTPVFIGLAVALAAVFAIYWFFLKDVVSLSALVAAKDSLAEFTRNNIWWLFLAAALAYFTATAVLLPTVLWLSILISYSFGAAFGVWPGAIIATAAIYIGVLAGVMVAFLVVKHLVGDSFRDKFGASIDKIAKGVEEDAFFYLMAMRLIPGIPFIVSNAAPAFVRVPLPTYLLATAIGILPGTFVYAYLGASLTTAVNPNGISASWEIGAAFAGLALLSIIPIVFKRLTAKNAKAEA